MHVQPPAGRSRIDYLPDAVRVEIPAKRNWFVILFLSVWLCAWTVGEIMVPTQFLTGKLPGPAVAFSLVWLAMWTMGGAVVMATIAWNLLGREIVHATPSGVEVRLDVRGLGRSRSYDPKSISNLRLESAQAYNPFDPRTSMSVWGLGGGRIAFDYGASTVRFGSRLDDPEVREIIKALERVLPRT